MPIDLTPKQGKAWRLLSDKTHTEVLYGGGAGGGKSWFGALWLMSSCLRYPGSRWLMGRAVLKTLKETTLNSFFDVCSKSGLRAGVDYTYNQQTSQIAVGRSTILLKDLFSYPSDPNFDDLGSLEITGAFIDEANQVSDRAKMIVSSRIRYQLGEFGLVPKLLMTCNPAKNWVYSDFYAPWKAGTLEAHRAFVPALVTDNPHIPSAYVDNLRRMPDGDPMKERLLYGNWEYDDDPARLVDADAVSDLFTNAHVTGQGKYISADVARYGSDRTVILLWEGMRVVHATVMDRSSIAETAAAVSSLAKLERVPRSHIVVDDDGIGGGVVDLLPGCVPFKGGAKPITVKKGGEEYYNLKAQCIYTLAQYVNDREVWWSFDRWHKEVTEELGWMKRDKMNMDGKLRVLGKDGVKEGLRRSPDFADALMMRMVFELRGDGIAARNLAARGREYAREEFKKNVGRGFGIVD